MRVRGAIEILAVAALVGVAGCDRSTTVLSTPMPIATGALEGVTVWNRPAQRPGELGENVGSSFSEKGSRVEIYDQFILITLPSGRTILSPHGWYTDLNFKRDPRP